MDTNQNTEVSIKGLDNIVFASVNCDLWGYDIWATFMTE